MGKVGSGLSENDILTQRETPNDIAAALAINPA